MVVVRLARGGSRNRPYFYIIVADSRSRRDGRFIEKIGFYNPLTAEDDIQGRFRVDISRLDYWVGVGAQVSPAVAKLVKKNNPKKAA